MRRQSVVSPSRPRLPISDPWPCFGSQSHDGQVVHHCSIWLKIGIYGDFEVLTKCSNGPQTASSTARLINKTFIRIWVNEGHPCGKSSPSSIWMKIEMVIDLECFNYSTPWSCDSLESVMVMVHGTFLYSTYVLHQCTPPVFHQCTPPLLHVDF
jgi:hypothetical protein